MLAQSVRADEKLTFLTSDENPLTRDYWATFSPDGKQVLFSRRQRPRGKWQLFVVPAKGGEARPLLKSPIPVSATRATWSKSNKIAFTGGTRNRQQQLWIVSGDGTDPKHVEVPGLSQSVFYPYWYPSGKQVAVMDAGKRSLMQVDLERRKASRLTDPSKFLAGMSCVSPNGKWVAFAGQKNRGEKYDQTKNTICIIEGDTTRTVESEPKQGRNPAWSPDGHWIAFASNRGNTNGRSPAIFIMNRNGAELRRVTPYSWRASHPVWSPDGKSMVFAATNPKNPRVSGIAIMKLATKHAATEE